MGLDARKPVMGGFANNKGADQTVHLRSLISTFVIHLLVGIISRLATSLYKLISIAEQAGLNLSLSETPKTDFVTSRPNYMKQILITI